MGESATSHASKDRLAHVLWIGGATDAGKTSIARALADKHGWQQYHYDRMDHLEPPGHWARADPIEHPHMTAALRLSLDEAWVHPTPEAMVELWRQTTAERFRLALEDLLALPAAPPVVAEGYGFLPDLVAPLLTSPEQGVWLVPTEAFKRLTFDRRARRGEKGGLWPKTSDPARARANHVARDLRIGEMVRVQARDRGLALYDVDGAVPLADLTARVEGHFAAYLRRSERHLSGYNPTNW